VEPLAFTVNFYDKRSGRVLLLFFSICSGSLQESRLKDDILRYAEAFRVENVITEIQITTVPQSATL